MILQNDSVKTEMLVHLRCDIYASPKKMRQNNTHQKTMTTPDEGADAEKLAYNAPSYTVGRNVK